MGTNSTQVLIIGAGVAGLTAARRLVDKGIGTVILDKGRAPGGRMATRTVGDARFDHGAQHFSARSAQFAAEVAAWTEQGLVREWFRSASRTTPDRRIEPRYVGRGGMRRIPEALAEGLNVQTGATVERLLAVDGKVAGVVGGNLAAVGVAVILTPPVPQTRRLLEAGGAALPDRVARMLAGVEYDPCLAMMASLDGPSGLPDGHRSPGNGPIAWMGDNHHKGASAVPAVTVHATPEFSVAHLEEPPEQWLGKLRHAAAVHCNSRIVAVTGHRWRYAQPRSTFEAGAVGCDVGFPAVIAGEAFSGARVEGAYMSGVAAASRVLEYL